MGGKSDGGAAAAMAEARGLAKDAAKQYKGVEKYIPEEERLLYSGLVAPELIVPGAEERILDTELAGVEADPRLQAAQEEALAEMEERGRVGLTAEDRAKMDVLRRQVGADAQARQASILSQMAQRGSLDSGAQLAMQQAANQAATQRATEGASQLGAQAAQARREALSQAAQTAGGMQQAKYGRESDVALNRDAMKKFNAAVAQRGTGARQQQARDIANVKMMQEQQRVQAAQMPFQQHMQLAGAKAGALTGQSNLMMQQAGMAKPEASGLQKFMGGAGTGAAIGSAGGPWGAAIGAGVGGLAGVAAADGGVKYADGSEFNRLDYGGMPEEVARQRYNEEQARIGQRLAEERHLKEAAMEKGVIGSGQVSRSEFDSARGQTPDGAKPGASKDGGSGMSGAGISSMIGGLSGLLGGGGESAPRPSFKPISLDLPAIQNIQSAQVQQFADGGMNYEAGGEGTIIDSGMESYAGDELEDRINDGEMVLNLDQQDNLNALLQELAMLRGDESVDAGMADVNELQQDKLMGVVRGEIEPEALLENGGEIVEPAPEMLEEALEGQEYADGGRSPAYAKEMGDDSMLQPYYGPLSEDELRDRRSALGDLDVNALRDRIGETNWQDRLTGDENLMRLQRLLEEHQSRGGNDPLSQKITDNLEQGILRNVEEGQKYKAGGIANTERTSLMDLLDKLQSNPESAAGISPRTQYGDVDDLSDPLRDLGSKTSKALDSLESNPESAAGISPRTEYRDVDDLSDSLKGLGREIQDSGYEMKGPSGISPRTEFTEPKKEAEGSLEGPLDLENMQESLANLGKPTNMSVGEPDREGIKKALAEAEPSKGDWDFDKTAKEMDAPKKAAVKPEAPKEKAPESIYDRYTMAEIMAMGGPAKAEAAMRKEAARKPAVEAKDEIQESLKKTGEEPESIKDSKTPSSAKAPKAPSSADDLFKQQLQGIEDQRMGAAIADALSGLSNILHRYNPKEIRVVLPVESMKNLDKKKQKIIDAKTARDKQKALEDYKSETLKIQKNAQDIQIKRLEASDKKSQKTAERQLGKEERLSRQHIQNKFLQAKDKLNKDFRYKDAYKEDLAFEKVGKLVDLSEKGNEVAFKAVGAPMARAMGEVGVLTDEDIKRYVKAGSLSRAAADTLENWIHGRAAKETLGDIKEIANVLREHHKTKIPRIFDDYAKSTSRILDHSLYETYHKLNLPMPPRIKKIKAFYEKNKGKQGIETLKDAENKLRELKVLEEL